MPHMANLPWLQTYFLLPIMLLLFLSLIFFSLYPSKLSTKKKIMSKMLNWKW